MRRVVYWTLTVLALFALSHGGHAACPEVCDGNSNTGLGNAALSSLTTGQDNTAVGDIRLEKTSLPAATISSSAPVFSGTPPMQTLRASVKRPKRRSLSAEFPARPSPAA